MRPASDAFLRAVRGSHVMRARARVVAPGQTGTDPAGTFIPIIEGKGGTVIADAKAKVRSRLDMVTDGTQAWPLTTGADLAPYGNEVFVERGIAFGDGTFEWVSLGYHRIDTIEQESTPDGRIRIDGRDRMAGIIDARLIAPVQFAANTTLGTVVTQLVTDVYPAAVIEWDDATDLSTLGRTLVAEQQRHEFLEDLISSVGKVMYWDHRGVLVIEDPPDPASPVYTVDAGENGVLVTMSRALTREDVFNAVVAFGEAPGTDQPARAVVVDDNPNSPTFWDGPFGKVPRFYSSPFITTDAQAESAATAILRQHLGLTYNVDLAAVPNVALVPLDPVAVVYPARSRSPNTRTETHVLDRITYPLSAKQPMVAATREQTLVALRTLP